MSINISDYNYSGVFIEERNNSQLDTPAASEAVINFVPGFSKNGTVFNRPVYIKNRNDRERYFGNIDRQLEKKGSYFHRTLDIATQTAPIWAMNLLATTEDDELNYKSVSVASQYENDIVKFRQYDDFFNKAGFWQRDVESFLNFAESSERMIHFTNLSDKKISVFMFKSTVPGFDITAENWYGGNDKVPTWMSPTDLISDYMVRVVVVRGDWSNYVQLAVDNNWSQFFTTAGLRKTQVDNFINNSNVNLLADYNGSLIPYFRDTNNNNLFIETLINSQTDITGLYCSYDLDRVETDFPTGVVDIIGHTLVDANRGNIKFMSYDEIIEETDTFEETQLDRLGNVIGINSITSNKTTNFKNGTINNSTITLDNTTPAEPELNITTGSIIINNTEIDINPQNIVLSAMNTPVTGSHYNVTVVYLDDAGTLQFIEGAELQAASTLSEGDPSLANLTYPANYPNSAVVVGHVFREFDGTIYTNTYVPLALDNTGFIEITISDNASNPGEILVDTSLSNNILDLEFLFTNTVSKADYAVWRSFKFFEELVNNVSFGRTVIITNTGGVQEKVFINGTNWVDNSSTPTGNRRITITVDSSLDIQSESTDVGNNALVIYVVDDEFIVDNGIAVDLEGFETNQTSNITPELGVVAKYSQLYQDYFNGIINTGDHFYVKLGVPTGVRFANYTDTSNPSSIGEYLIMETIDYNTLGLTNQSHILINDHTVNNGDFELGDAEASNGSTFGPDLAADPTIQLSASETAIKLNTPIVQDLNSVTVNIYDFNDKIYLKMYTVGDVLQVRFMSDNALTQFTSIDVNLVQFNTEISVYSKEGSIEQTLEIEQHPNYTITDTKFLVDNQRYSEVRTGDYVKAFVDPNELEPGEYKNRFVRITKKTPWSENAANNVDYAEITVDGKYDVRSFGNNDLQTETYKSVDNYVNSYKAITLNGFKVRQDSTPDGTEERQQEILDIVAKDTPLYDALVNKNQFNFRYLIDCWGNGLVENSKQQLMDITGKRKNALAILNMPSAKTFKQSNSPVFTNDDGTLNLEYVKDGGNLDLNPLFLYSFGTGSGKDDGRDTAGYFFPFLTINDNGRPLDFVPAPFVANTYTRKLNSPVAGTYNWTVAAGIEDGLIRNVRGTEMPFTEKDLISMYTMGANPIVYTKNIGYNIETEWSALRQPISALSYLHVRELLIDLENELFAMLLKYRWKFNTPQIRAKIKREADEICQSYEDRGGLYAYENIIDETNNTPTLIDNQFGLLETYIEPVKSMGIIVNVINVQATGDIGNSTGFQQQ